MDWDNIEEQLIKVAVGCGENGIDAAFNGIRTWLNEKGLFDDGTLSRWEFESAAILIKKIYTEQIRDALKRTIGGDSK